MSSLMKEITSPTKTIAVLGAAYGGARAAQVLAKGIPDGWRIVLVDRNSHANHVYILPRLAVLPGHEHKAFVPYDKVFLVDQPSTALFPHVFVKAQVTSFGPNSVTLSHSFPEHGILNETLHFDYAIYALGSALPLPLNLWGPEACGSAPTMNTSSEGGKFPKYQGTKAEGVSWLKRNQVVIEDSPSVLVVGGGALGIQFATDIAAVYPTKRVTLLHSRNRLLPRFDDAMHTEILQSLESFDIEVILGERLDLESTREEPPNVNKLGQRIVRTVKGREIAADLILLCTGQSPNTRFLKEMDAATVEPESGLAHVLPTMQLGVLPLTSEHSSAAGSSTSATPRPGLVHAIAEDENVNAEALGAALSQVTLDDMGSSAELASVSEDDVLSPLIGIEGSATEEEDDQTSIEEEILEETPYPHIFVIGDAADAFGAIKAGHNAYFQGEVAARNIIKLIQRQEKLDNPATHDAGGTGPIDDALELYQPNAPAIKVSLGLTKCVYQFNGIVGVHNDNKEDLGAASIWAYFGVDVQKEEDMYA